MNALAILILLGSSLATIGSIYYLIRSNAVQRVYKKKWHKGLNEILGIILCTAALFSSSLSLELFIHETGHAYTAFFYNIPITSIIIIPFRGGFTSIDLITINNVSIVSQIIISGGLTISIILIILIIGLLRSSRGLRIEIFIPVYLVLTFNILNEIEYWIRSLREGAGDAFAFLSFNPSLNASSMMHILNSIYWTVLFFLYLILGLYLLINYRKHKKKRALLEKL